MSRTDLLFEYARQNPALVAGITALSSAIVVKKFFFPTKNTYYNGKVIIVTGASSGIAKACSLQLAQQGALLVLVARREKELSEVAAECNRLAGGRDIAIPVVADVSIEENCKRVIDATIAKFGRLDVLLSVAGISMAARFEDILPGSNVLEKLMATNYYGPVNLTKYALPHLIKSKGRIGVVTSGAAVIPFATRTGYCGSKYAVLGFFEALRWELGPRYDIHITTVVPALTAGTNVNQTRVGFDGNVTLKGGFPPTDGMPKEKAAKTILDGIANKKRDVTFDMGFWAFMRQIFPCAVEWIFNTAADKMMGGVFPLNEKPKTL